MIKYSIVLFILTIAQAQIVHPSKYNYEKLNWGDNLTKVKNKFNITKYESTGGSFSPFTKKRNDIFQYLSIDTIQSEKVQIIFQFHSADSTLQSVFVSYFDLNSKNENEDIVKAANLRILDILTKHYPSEYQERTVPLAGTIRVWSFDKTYVQGYVLSSMVSVVLTKQ